MSDPTRARAEAYESELGALTALVDVVVAEQCGEAMAATIRSIRDRAIGARDDPDRLAATRDVVAGLDLAAASVLARTASTLFHLADLGEARHRGARRGPVRSALLALRGAGVTADEVAALLARLEVRPVLTAHPTEARRQTVLRHLEHLADVRAAPECEDELVLAELTTLWQTEEVRAEGVDPLDEVDTGIHHLAGTVYDVVPTVYRAVQSALDEAYPGAGLVVPTFLRFGSWIGGDRDGNPSVTVAVTEETLRRHRRAVLARHLRELRRLGAELSQSRRRVGVSDALLASIGDDDEDEPYRRKIDQMADRLRRTMADETDGYASPAELRVDLALLHGSLHEHRGVRIADRSVRDLAWRVDTFGFHLAELDIRQESDVHGRVVASSSASTGTATSRGGEGRDAVPGARPARRRAERTTLRRDRRDGRAVRGHPAVAAIVRRGGVPHLPDQPHPRRERRPRGARPRRAGRRASGRRPAARAHPRAAALSRAARPPPDRSCVPGARPLPR